MIIDFDKLFERVKLVILHPAQAWDTISGEDLSKKQLIINTLAPILVASAISACIDNLMFNRLGPAFAITNSLVAATVVVASSLSGAYIIKALAPALGGGLADRRALSLIVHSELPALLGGILAILPLIGPLAGPGLALYSLYVFYLGVSKMTGVPHSRALPFTAISVLFLTLTMLVVSLLLGAIFSSTTRLGS